MGRSGAGKVNMFVSVVIIGSPDRRQIIIDGKNTEKLDSDRKGQSSDCMSWVMYSKIIH